MAAVSDEFALAEAEQRPYQTTIARQCYGRNSLVVLPTGLGKTIICALVAARHLDDGQRVLVVAPTRPLVEQHADTFREQLPDIDVAAVTGDDGPDDRGDIWTDADVAVATPHVVRNDLYADRVDPDTWGLLVVDEAHRAVGNYAAVPVAQRLRRQGCRVLGATASPGSDVDRIQEVCDTLGIEHVEARGEWDDDVEPYVDPVSIEWVRVGLPNSLEDAAGDLREAAEGHVDELRSLGHYSSRFLKRGPLLELRDALQTRLEGDRKQQISRALDHVHRALKLLHGVKLVETQSTAAAREYLAELAEIDAEEEALADARRRLEGYMGEHPKMRRCARELQAEVDDDGRALVFVQTRDTAKALVDALDERHRLDADLFVGQSGEDGLTQREQLDRIEAFREGETNVLVSTSVGEEGLDIPDVDLVVFYEAVASAIRSIQRRGRTGREGRGRVVVLMARGTSDEAAYWAANRREQRMKRLVRDLQADSSSDPEPVIRENPSADEEDEDLDGPGVIVDHRELNGSLARLLAQEGISLEPSTVAVGDLVVSNRLVVERKTARDFVESVIDGRLMDQARTLKKNYDAPVVIVEGDPFATSMQVSEEAISGAIAALGTSFNVPVLTVEDTRRAAQVVTAMARREHEESGPPKLRHDTGGRSLPDQQQFLLEGLPKVSSTLARRLLEHFGSPGAALSATEEELEDVDGIGPTTATAIHEVLHERTETPWQTETSPSTPPRASATPSGTGPGKSAS
jgi:Fanconi anemia group M protein